MLDELLTKSENNNEKKIEDIPSDKSIKDANVIKNL